MLQHKFHALTLVATAAAVLAAAACGSSGNGSSNSSGGSTSGPISGHSDSITAVGSSATSGSGGGSGGYSTEPIVRVRSSSEPYYFTPTPDTIAVGSTVTFIFQDVNHTVTFSTDSNPGDVANISSVAAGGVANADSTRIFSTAGVYMYHCSIHPYMVGVIVVH